MTNTQKQYIKANSDSLLYLFNLQNSGRTNMFGAAAYLEREQGLDKKTAKEVLLFWMENYEEIAKELGVEI